MVPGPEGVEGIDGKRVYAGVSAALRLQGAGGAGRACQRWCSGGRWSSSSARQR